MSEQNINEDTYSPTGDEEPIRKCPYCGEEKKSRGLFAHVLNTDGNGHGPYREVPDGFEATDAEIVGFENIDKEEPISQSESGKEIILCEICGNTTKGVHGFRIHAKKMAGKRNHPEDPTNITNDQFQAIPADEHWNPIGPYGEQELDEEHKEMIGWENGNADNKSEKTIEGMFVPIDEMNKLRDILITSREKQPVIDEFERVMERYS